jgi:mRNA interferase MazF
MAENPKITRPRRGEVYLVNFDPAIGAKIKRTRPALVLQNDIANRWSPITIVSAITSRFEEPVYPTEVLVRAPEGGLEVDGVVILNQIRSIDKRRLVRRLGMLRPERMRQVEQAILISLGIVRMLRRARRGLVRWDGTGSLLSLDQSVPRERRKPLKTNEHGGRRQARFPPCSPVFDPFGLADP